MFSFMPRAQTARYDKTGREQSRDRQELDQLPPQVGDGFFVQLTGFAPGTANYSGFGPDYTMLDMYAWKEQAVDSSGFFYDHPNGRRGTVNGVAGETQTYQPAIPMSGVRMPRVSNDIYGDLPRYAWLRWLMNTPTIGPIYAIQSAPNTAGARVYHNATTTVPSGAAATKLNFNSTRFDTGGTPFVDRTTDPAQLHLKITTDGYYQFGANVIWSDLVTSQSLGVVTVEQATLSIIGGSQGFVATTVTGGTQVGGVTQVTAMAVSSMSRFETGEFLAAYISHTATTDRHLQAASANFFCYCDFWIQKCP